MSRLEKRMRSRVVALCREFLIRVDRLRGKECQLVFRLANGRPNARRGQPERNVSVLTAVDQLLEPQIQTMLRNTPHLGSESEVADALRQGQRLYFIARQDKAICSLWTSRPQARGRKWYVPLSPRDVVLIRFHTDIDWRGRRLIGGLLEIAVSQELELGGEVYVDCSARNWASRRAIERARFELVARTRTVRKFESTTLG